MTPGALNPAVTQATIAVTICVSRWTATVRPPSSYTTALKIRQIATYGYTTTTTSAYEEDHLIPLELGGAPKDPRNLWPEPYAARLSDGRDVGARAKDTYESSLRRQVCAGTLTLADAQARIGIHWVHAFYGFPLATVSAPSTSAPPSPTLPPSPIVRASGGLDVTFVGLPDPAAPGSSATMTARTSPGAVCSATVTWPSGRVSTASGLQTIRTAGSAGLVNWTWNVSATTKSGTATASVTCTLATTATATTTTATTTFPVATR